MISATWYTTKYFVHYCVEHPIQMGIYFAGAYLGGHTVYAIACQNYLEKHPVKGKVLIPLLTTITAFVLYTLHELVKEILHDRNQASLKDLSREVYKIGEPRYIDDFTLNYLNPAKKILKFEHKLLKSSYITVSASHGISVKTQGYDCNDTFCGVHDGTKNLLQSCAEKSHTGKGAYGFGFSEVEIQIAENVATEMCRIFDIYYDTEQFVGYDGRGKIGRLSFILKRISTFFIHPLRLLPSAGYWPFAKMYFINAISKMKRLKAEEEEYQRKKGNHGAGTLH